MPLNPGQQPSPPIPVHVPNPPVIAQPVSVKQAASLPLAQMIQASRAFNPHAPRAAATSPAAVKQSTSEAALALMAANKSPKEAASSKSLSIPGRSVKRGKLRGPASVRGL